MLRLQIDGIRHAGRTLDVMRLPPQKRRTLLRTLGRAVRRDSKNRVQTQRTLSGAPMQARSPKSKGKGLMLKGLGRRMLVITDSADQVRVGWRGGKVAFKHQFGVNEHFTADKLRQRSGEHNQSGDDPATRRQARRLLSLGYKIRRGRRGWKRPTIAWIQANMTIDHAGKIIRILSNAEPTSEWDVKLPDRPFLGVTPTENAELLNTIIDAMTRQRPP